MLVKESVLALLMAHQADVPISGQTLADELGVSRNAIWKAIEELRLNGYAVTSHGKKGYQLEHMTTQLDALQLQQQIAPLWHNLQVNVFESVTSTNDLAKQFAIESPHHCALFIAQHQTKGRGRLGRQFHSQIEDGLYFSLVIPIHYDDPTHIPLYTLLAASSIVKAIESLTSLSLKIKWVNDIFLNQHKVAGILTEATSNLETQTIDTITIGIGINLAGNFDNADSTTQKTAGTLFGSQTPPSFNRNDLIVEFIKHFTHYQQHFDTKSFLHCYRDHLLGLHQQVFFDKESQRYTGIIRGINDEGHLLIEYSDGTIDALFSSQVHFSSEQFTTISS